MATFGSLVPVLSVCRLRVNMCSKLVEMRRDIHGYKSRGKRNYDINFIYSFSSTTEIVRPKYFGLLNTRAVDARGENRFADDDAKMAANSKQMHIQSRDSEKGTQSKQMYKKQTANGQMNGNNQQQRQRWRATRQTFSVKAVTKKTNCNAAKSHFAGYCTWPKWLLLLLPVALLSAGWASFWLPTPPRGISTAERDREWEWEWERE